MVQRFVASRARLERVHGRGEKAASALEAVTMVVGGVVAFIGGLRALLDIVAPSPAEESSED